MRPVRIFLGLGDTGGYYSRLEDGLKSIGVTCTFVDAYPMRDYPRYYRPGRLGRTVEWLGRHRFTAPEGSMRRIAWKVLQAMFLPALLVHSIVKFDVFVFAGGTSFFGGADLPLLRLLGKRVIVVYHGSDCRPPYISGVYAGADMAFDARSCIALTRRIYRWVTWVDAYADVVLNHPYSSHFNTRPIVSWLAIGNPFHCRPIPTAPRPDGACVIVHAPTRPAPKGSVEIEAAVERARQRGHDVKFVKIVGRPPHEVLEALATCDFLIDELYGDTPMAALATEAASMAKPAIVGMHDVDSLRKTMPDGMFPPALVCHPGDLDTAIEKLVVDVEFRRRLGAEARAYVEANWSHATVARRILALAAGDISPEWTFDPSTLRYLHGWGLTETRLREVVSSVIAVGGLEALKVSDKPELERGFARLAGRTPTVDSQSPAT